MEKEKKPYIARCPTNLEIYERIEEVLEQERFKMDFIWQPTTPETVYRILEWIFRPIISDR